jgi:hypothetical protein
MTVTGDYAEAAQSQRVHEEQSNRSAAEHDSGSAKLDLKRVQPVQDTGQRLDQRGLGEAQMVGNEIGIAAGNALRDEDVFGVGAVEELQPLAQALAPLPAIRAFATRRAIRRDHPLPHSEALDARADLGDDTGELMAKRAGQRFEDARMPSTVRFQVRAAGQRRSDLDEQLARPRRRNRRLDQPRIARTVK